MFNVRDPVRQVRSLDRDRPHRRNNPGLDLRVDHRLRGPHILTGTRSCRRLGPAGGLRQNAGVDIVRAARRSRRDRRGVLVNDELEPALGTVFAGIPRDRVRPIYPVGVFAVIAFVTDERLEVVALGVGPD